LPHSVDRTRVVPQTAVVTTRPGYALSPDEALEVLDMGGGNTLALRVTSRESDGLVTVLEGVLRGSGPPLHVHDDEDEVVLLLEGAAVYRLGEATGELGAGGLLWLPRGVPHAFAALGNDPVRFVTVVTPGGVEDFFRAQRDALLENPDDPSVLAGVAGAERRRVVGPPLR
jgi:quercetin dioxygenase-like cupin family protein